ncbi:DUF692 family multinuclear iron-containing protein [Streptomyces pathocidini]|uniref:DUF692 family multinuclear iron-containing protein n=1 Tax=Streptomyces pathocidini TaxID=1650571 RepID=A0ABW7UJA5_9ACTN|nr:DUF692 domain-containing protein [Streptomyces pathocidini]
MQRTDRRTDGLVLGTGIGWRPEIADAIAELPDIDWVEVVAENICPGHLPEPLLRLRERGTTVVPHGVSLGLGGADRPDPAKLAALAERAEVLGAPLVTEHIAFVRAGGPLTATARLEAGHLLPVPRTRDALDVLCENVRIAQDALPVPLALENIAALVAWPGEELSEGRFLAELVERTGVRLLIDVANLHTNHVNRGEDPAKTLDELPVEAIAYVHVAGGVEKDGVWHDSHAHPVTQPVLDVLAELRTRVAPPGVLLERDEDFPPAAELAAELSAIRAVLAAGDSERTHGRNHAMGGAPGRGVPFTPPRPIAGPGITTVTVRPEPEPTPKEEPWGDTNEATVSGPSHGRSTRKMTARPGEATTAATWPEPTPTPPPEEEPRGSATSKTAADGPSHERPTRKVNAPEGEATAVPASTTARRWEPTSTTTHQWEPASATHQWEPASSARQRALASTATRRRVGVAQAALLSALVAGAPAPEGFDGRRLRVQSRALAAKRADVVAKVAPELPEILGAGYRPAFLAYAQARPMTGGYRQDALDFAGHVLAECPPEDPTAHRNLATWWRDRSGPRPRRRLIRRLRATAARLRPSAS